MKKILVIMLMIFIVFLTNVNIGQAIPPELLEVIEEYKIYKNEDSAKEAPKKKAIDPLKKLVSNSKRINTLLLGKEEGPRTDTIVFISFEPENKRLDIISIPRDTYYHEEGYDNGGQRKINAKYGRSKEKGAMDAVGKILGGVPIHHYVTLNYQSVEQIVDALGGVEVDVPHQISDIPKGKQILNGKKAIAFLRHRKGYRNGDLGRVNAQQQFIKSAINKLFSKEALPIAKELLTYIQTDMNEKEILSYAIQALNIKTENISMKTLPGTSKYTEVGGHNWWYYLHNQEKTKELILQLYNVE